MGSHLEPKGESLKKAIRWLSSRRREEPDARPAALLDEAALKFDLNPAEQEFLWRNFRTLGSDEESG